MYTWHLSNVTRPLNSTTSVSQKMIETLYQYTILDIEVTTLDSRLLSLEMT